jgi:Domain of unknown function (DUF4884)
LIILFIQCKTFQSSIPIKISTPDNNSTYKIEYLFEHDGCKVYRFLDNSNFVYFTSCNGETTSVVKDTSSILYIKSTNKRN